MIMPPIWPRQGGGVAGPENIVELGPKAVLRGLLDVAKVALGPHMPDISDEETAELLVRLLAVIDRAMPGALKNQDMRILSARMLAEALTQ